MVYQRGEIVELIMPMPPDGRPMNHPFVIISNTNVHLDDDCYIGLMLTSSQQDDIYSYPIEAHMFVSGRSTTAYAEARCHLVSTFLDKDILHNRNRAQLRRAFVDDIVEHMRNTALS